MAFRVRLLDSPESFDVERGEPLLAAALRCDVKLPHACTLGGCGTCRVKVVEGRVRYDEMPMALSPEEAAQGYALACQARAESDLVIDVPRVELAEPSRQAAMVTDVAPLCDDVTHLSIVLPDIAALAYRPGQHMNLLLPDGTQRSFSMASPPAGNAVDFHIRRIPGGRFTQSMLAEMQPGDLVEVEIPLGTFRYHEEDYREILMVATGTGISPLKCILESLMDDPDCPPVRLYWGGRTPRDLYLHEEIPAWGERLFEFRYEPVLSRADASWSGHRGHVQDAVLRDIPDLSEHSIYLCGSPAMIHDAKAAFLARGASVDRLYADGFNFQR
ncbi:MAG: 2Fe-2S iron-sulfur cluster-binding protein [Betaproteobacteria bacterium]